MKYLIKIDKKSIKEKSNLRNNYTEISFISNFKPPIFLIENRDYFLTEWIEGIEYRGVINKELSVREIEIWKSFDNNLRFSFEKHYTDTYFNNMMKYSFSYKPKQIKCKFCQSKFDYTELKEVTSCCNCCEVCEDCDTIIVCPICNKEECCELEFEKVDKYIK